MAAVLLVGVGGFAGAVARYLVDRRVTDWLGSTFPWGTFLINVAGSFAVGVLFALIVERTHLSPSLRPALMVGFVGSFTTFSTWMLESWRLVEGGAWTLVVLNIGGSILAGFLALVAGLALGRAI